MGGNLSSTCVEERFSVEDTELMREYKDMKGSKKRLSKNVSLQF